MAIGIIDADLLGRKKHRFPNLVCEKLSGYWKRQGEEVELLLDYDHLDEYDRVYISKVFTDTPIPDWLLEYVEKNPDRIQIGGTGFYFDKAPNLPDEIEHHMPDYNLYNAWINGEVNKAKIKADQEGKEFDEKKYMVQFKEYTDYSIGFLTRGCFRKCKFCINQKYDHVFMHSPLSEFYDPSRKKICLLDDNVLGCRYWREILEELIKTGKPFKFKQGMDERLLTDEKCRILFNAKYDGDYTFAFDNVEDYKLIQSKLEIHHLSEEMLQEYKVLYTKVWNTTNVYEVAKHKLVRRNMSNQVCSLVQAKKKNLILFVIDGFGLGQYFWSKKVVPQNSNFAYSNNIFNWLNEEGLSNEYALGAPLVTDTAAGISQIFIGKTAKDTRVISSTLKKDGVARVVPVKNIDQSEFIKIVNTSYNGISADVLSENIASQFMRRYVTGNFDNKITRINTEDIFDNNLGFNSLGNYYESHLAWIKFGDKLKSFINEKKYTCDGNCSQCDKFSRDKLDLGENMKPKPALEPWNFDSTTGTPKKPDFRGKFCEKALLGECKQLDCSSCRHLNKDAYLKYLTVHTLKHAILWAMPKYAGVNITDLKGEIYPNDGMDGFDLVLVDNNEGGSGSIILIQRHWDEIWNFASEIIRLTKNNEANILLNHYCFRNNADLCPYIATDFFDYIES